MSKNTISFITVGIIILSIMASLVGIMSNEPSPVESFDSIFENRIEVYRKGIYAMNSVSVAAQGIASDWVIMLVGVPGLILSFLAYRKEKIKGQLIFIGILSFFFYTYMSYVFLWFYNELFLVYVALMSMSAFAIAGVFATMDLNYFKKSINRKKTIIGYAIIQIVVAAGIGLMWLGTIVPNLIAGTQPHILEHYTTLVIQAMDLGIVIPIAFYSSFKLLKKETIGYLLSPIILIKGMTMLLAIFAMLLNMLNHGVEVAAGQLLIFPIFCLLFALGIWHYMISIFINT